MKLLVQLQILPPWVIVGGSLFALTSGALILALFSFFSAPIVFFLVLLFGLGILYSLFLLWKSRDWWRMGFLTFLVLIAVVLGLSTEPSIFSGRDQGSLAEAAWQLAEQGKLTFSSPVSQAFFTIYGEGTALNFPGFAYTETGSLITQFPLGYIAWLASFVSVFGFFGYTLANLTLFVLFGWGMFELLLLFVPRLFALGGTLLGIMSFLPLWMAKFTLSENLAVVLFVLLGFCLTKLSREKTLLWYASSLLVAALFAFTRIEGFAFLGLVLLFILWQKETRSIALASPWKRIMIPALIFLFIFLRDFFMNLPFYKMIGKALVKKVHEWNVLGSALENGEGMSLGAIFSMYGLLILFLFALFGIILALSRKKYAPLIILFLASPTLLYLLLPSITPDHPWMLRRYYFSLYPLAILFVSYALFLLSTDKKTDLVRKPLAITLFMTLFVFQLGSALQALTLTENEGLLLQTEKFSESFGERDLILIDREATGDPFAMLAGPLHFLFDKQAAYFFNPADLPRLDLSAFEKVYVLSGQETLEGMADELGDRLIPKETVTIETKRLVPGRNFWELPQKAVFVTDSILFEITPP